MHDLKAKSAGHFAQFETAPDALLGNTAQCLTQRFIVRPVIVIEQIADVLDRQRLARSQQGTLNDALQLHVRKHPSCKIPRCQL